MEQKNKNFFIALVIPVAYGLIIRLLLGISGKGWQSLFEVMSVTFLFLVPTIMGVLMVYFSSCHKAKNIVYRIFMPWLAVFSFLLLTMVFAIEGWACWLMILPVFLIAASIGGLFGGYLNVQKKSNTLQVSILILLPFFLGSIEGFIEKIPATYKAILLLILMRQPKRYGVM